MRMLRLILPTLLIPRRHPLRPRGCSAVSLRIPNGRLLSHRPRSLPLLPLVSRITCRLLRRPPRRRILPLLTLRRPPDPRLPIPRPALPRRMIPAGRLADGTGPLPTCLIARRVPYGSSHAWPRCLGAAGNLPRRLRCLVAARWVSGRGSALPRRMVAARCAPNRSALCLVAAGRLARRRGSALPRCMSPAEGLPHWTALPWRASLIANRCLPDGRLRVPGPVLPRRGLIVAFGLACRPGGGRSEALVAAGCAPGASAL